MWVVNKFIVLLAVVLLTACGGGESSTDPKIVEIVISAEKSEISQNGSTQLEILAKFDDGTEKNIVEDITWKSNNLDIATISESGLLSSSDLDGSVIITATYNGETNVISINVKSNGDPEFNTAPSINSVASSTASESQLYSYGVDATDANASDILTYALDAAPVGMSIDGTSGLITWTPNSTQVASHLVSVKVTDNGSPSLSASQSFLVVVDGNVAGVNSAPTIDSVAITVAKEGQLYSYDVDASDSDTSDNLIFTLENAPSGMTIDGTSGVISWVPTAAQVTSILVGIKVTDSGSPALTASQNFQVVVAEKNIAPVFTSVPIGTANVDVAYTYQVTATDANKDTALSFTLDTTAEGMIIDEVSGLISWTPNEAAQAQSGGLYIVNVTVTDGELSKSQQYPVLINAANIKPIISSIPKTSANATVAYSYDVDASDVDNNNPLVYSLTNPPAGMEINETSGLISWIPGADQVGINSVTVVVKDNGIPVKIDTQEFSITVLETNVKPDFNKTAILSANPDAEYSYQLEATDANNGDVLGFSLTTKPSGMSIDGNGKITWMPKANQAGPQEVTALVTDNGTPFLTNTYTFFIEVAAANVEPVVDSVDVTTANPRVAYVYDVNATDGNVEDVLTYSLVSEIVGMAIDADGVITWTPTADQSGAQAVTVKVMDNGIPEKSINHEFTIDVAENNLAPVFGSLPLETVVEAGVEFSYTFTVTDAEDFSLEVTGPDGYVFDALTNTIKWTPTPLQLEAGQHPFVVTATDVGVPVEVATLEFSIGVQDLSAPTIPDGVVARATSTSQINVNWRKSTDIGGGTVASYIVYRDGKVLGDPVVSVADKDIYLFVDKSAKVNQDYIYQVEASDSAGNISELSQPFAIMIGGLPFSDDFNSSLMGWTIIDDGPGASSWSVGGGELKQISERGMLASPVNRRAALENQNTYHIGTYAYYPGLQWLADYRLSVDITPIEEPGFSLIDDGHDIGVMFRYVDHDNYYRVSLNSQYGYARLERKVNGAFKTLAVDARGYSAEGVVIPVVVDITGGLIQVYIDGEARFAAQDQNLNQGGIALYTQDGAKFKNVNITDNSGNVASIVIAQPEAYTAQPGTTFDVSAVALNASGDDVVFTVDGNACSGSTEVSPGYFTATCSAPLGEHTVTSTLSLAGVSDSNIKVGTSGEVRLVVGDSLSNGVVDTFKADNHSADGKVIAEQGYTAVLQDLLSAASAKPQIIFNEAIPGDLSEDLANDRLSSIIERHPDAMIAQILIGTNDTGQSKSVDAYRSNMQKIVSTLATNGITPVIARISPSFNPTKPEIDVLVKTFNTMLETDFAAQLTGPDLYTYFMAAGEGRQSLFVDSVHFNGLAHVIVAHLWNYSLLNGNSGLPDRIDLPLVLEGICVRTDSAACQAPLTLTYKQDLMELGNPLYVDSADTVDAIPAELDGGVWIRTEDANRDNALTDHLEFNVDRAVMVYVAYEDGAAVPTWLSEASGFSAPGNLVNVSGTDLRLYSKMIAGGAVTTVTLGGAEGASANYVVIVKEM